MDPCLGEERAGLVAEGVFLVVDDFDNPRIDDHLRTGQAGAQRHVEDAAPYGDAMIRRLHDGVFLGVGTNAIAEPASRRGVTSTPHTTAVIAILNAPRRAVVSRRDNPLVLDDNRRHLPSPAVTPRLHHMGNAHKILIP